VAAGVFVLVFGLLCLNYTNADGWERHTLQAERFGLPPPSRSIHRLGMATTALGGVLTGLALARRPPA
jgi:hypothetical protein